MNNPSDVEQLRAVIEDQGGEIDSLRQAASDAENRMWLMTQLRDPEQVLTTSRKFAAEIDDLYAGGYASVAERSACVMEKVSDLIVRAAIGTSVASGCSLSFTLTDAARQKAALEKKTT